MENQGSHPLKKEITNTVGASAEIVSKLVPDSFIKTGKHIVGREVTRLVQKVFPIRFGK